MLGLVLRQGMGMVPAGLAVGAAGLVVWGLDGGSCAAPTMPRFVPCRLLALTALLSMRALAAEAAADAPAQAPTAVAAEAPDSFCPDQRFFCWRTSVGYAGFGLLGVDEARLRSGMQVQTGLVFGPHVELALEIIGGFEWVEQSNHASLGLALRGSPGRLGPGRLVVEARAGRVFMTPFGQLGHLDGTLGGAGVDYEMKVLEASGRVTFLSAGIGLSGWWGERFTLVPQASFGVGFTL